MLYLMFWDQLYPYVVVLMTRRWFRVIFYVWTFEVIGSLFLRPD